MTDTDSGMQQEHSRKSMFSAEEGGREGETDADAERQREAEKASCDRRQPAAMTFLFDFRLASCSRDLGQK